VVNVLLVIFLAAGAGLSRSLSSITEQQKSVLTSCSVSYMYVGSCQSYP